MCAACVAQGVTYVGGALAGLQVMAGRARAKRSGAASEGPTSSPSGEPVAVTPDDR